MRRLLLAPCEPASMVECLAEGQISSLAQHRRGRRLCSNGHFCACGAGWRRYCGRRGGRWEQQHHVKSSPLADDPRRQRHWRAMLAICVRQVEVRPERAAYGKTAAEKALTIKMPVRAMHTRKAHLILRAA